MLGIAKTSQEGKGKERGKDKRTLRTKEEERQLAHQPWPGQTAQTETVAESPSQLAHFKEEGREAEARSKGP